MTDNDGTHTHEIRSSAEHATPEQAAAGELSLARIAIAEDDLAHAANHVAAAIALAPSLPEAHEALATIAARVGDGGLSLFPLGESNYIGVVVAHAHLLSATDPAGGLDILVQATSFEPVKPWADVPWVRSFDPRQIDPDSLARILTKMMMSLGDPASPEVRKANEVYLELVSKALAAYPEHGMLHAVAAGVCRRIGPTGLAVVWGRRAVELDPSKMTWVWYAYALRADGRLDEAVQAVRDALKEFPLELDLYADMAEWLAAAGRLDEAIAEVEQAARLDDTYDCAIHTLHRLRFERDGDPRHLIVLSDFIRDHPVTSHEHNDLEQACDGRTWLGQVPLPSEACLNGFAAATQHGSPVVHMAMTGLESPSAIAIVRRSSPESSISISGDLPADALAPLRDVRALWHYQGTEAHPAVPAPDPRASELLAQVALPYWPHPVAAYDHALPLGELPVDELLSLLVFPPAAPEHFHELPVGVWERGCQVFACLGILHCRELSSGQPGDTASQRRLLTDIAFGVEDWTTDAALFALAVAAWVDPSCRESVGMQVSERFLEAAKAAGSRYVPILPSLIDLVRMVPGVARQCLDIADAFEAMFDSDDEES